MLRSQLLLLAATVTVMPMNGRDEVLFKFDKTSDSREWKLVNDRVMGGVSNSRVEIMKDGTLRFFGSLSLENKGGFASVRSLPNERDLSAYNGILVWIKGEGHRYAINLRTDFEVRAGSYRHHFETQNAVWQQVFLPFTGFQLTSFGQIVKEAPPLNTRKIRSVGFLISDKQAGPFVLQIDWIRAAKNRFPIPKGSSAQSLSAPPRRVQRDAC